MSRVSALFSLLVVPGLVACDSSDGDDDTTDAVTLVAVDSTDFPAEVNCAPSESGELPGGAYVADLIDVSGAVELDGKSIDPFLVQSSPPVPCGQGIAFAKVAENRSYEIVVRIYPDLDGDPTTVDICTLAPTNVTMQRVDGRCSTSLATPSATLRCYGWEQSTDSRASDLTPPRGEPVLAIDQRKVLASYCIEKNPSASD